LARQYDLFTLWVDGKHAYDSSAAQHVSLEGRRFVRRIGEPNGVPIIVAISAAY
jgi:hypothetical protein